MNGGRQLKNSWKRRKSFGCLFFLPFYKFYPPLYGGKTSIIVEVLVSAESENLADAKAYSFKIK